MIATIQAISSRGATAKINRTPSSVSSFNLLQARSWTTGVGAKCEEVLETVHCFLWFLWPLTPSHQLLCQVFVWVSNEQSSRAHPLIPSEQSQSMNQLTHWHHCCFIELRDQVEGKKSNGKVGKRVEMEFRCLDSLIPMTFIVKIFGSVDIGLPLPPRCLFNKGSEYWNGMTSALTTRVVRHRLIPKCNV